MVYDKQQLVQYRISRAKETIDEAHLVLEKDRLNLAANRIYYAGYYIVSALALQQGFSTSKHYQLMGWFNKEFVKSGRVPKEMGRIFLNAFETRQEGDYEDMISFDKELLKDKLKQMEVFVDSVEKLILSDKS